MINLTVKSNVKEISAKLGAFAKEQQVAAVRALNKTAEQARTAASKEVRAAGYNIKASAIKKSFYIKKANKYSLEVSLTATGRPITLINYSARQTKGGVKVKVKNGTSVLPHAFIAVMPNGHKGVYSRIKGGGHKVVKRDGKLVRTGLPIKELYGPSIPQGLNNKVVTESLMRLIRDKFPKILEHELKFAISKR